MAEDIVSLMKSYAHFGYYPEEVRASLLKTAIRNSSEYDFATLGDICQSLSLLEAETNKTFLDIIRNRIVGYAARDEIEHLIYRPTVLQQDPAQLHLEDPTADKAITEFLERKDYLREVQGANYILPKQVEQFMRAFS